MDLSTARYIIGIDLGTTNSAVSCIDLLDENAAKARPAIFQIPQFSGPGEISRLNTLPSFLYLPGQHEINPEAVILPWPSDSSGIVGAFARDQGAKVPKRMVSSAKSWLCHGKVDRRAAILPWGAEEDIPRVSPIAASAAYLHHIRAAWNYYQAENEDYYLEKQTVVITVPASFDEVARDLTVEAATQAGIKNITLLEEPLAAFYSWLTVHEQDWDRFVRPGQLILVCDVGGGTTDFTLITLRELDGKPIFDRLAVGDHLILGGDNMDLALARRSEARLQKTPSGSLSLHRWQALCHQCRAAKENILSGLAESKTITLVGGGRRLIAETLSTTIDRAEVEEVLLDGFFPVIKSSDPIETKPRGGITEFGLPYAQDPAITRHLIQFLQRHQADVAQTLGRKTAQPDLILFTGGALKPAIVQARIREAIRNWYGVEDLSAPAVLHNADLDLAVALGASYYGLVKRGHGVRVGSGAARSYYLGVGRAKSGAAKTGRKDMAICLVERGMEEGSKIEIQDKTCKVLANQPISFDLYSSSFRTGDRVGDVISVDDTLTAMPPILTVIQFGKKAQETSVPVKVEAGLTEVGTLALWCRSIRSNHRWRLQFQLRVMESIGTLSDAMVFEESTVDRVLEIVRDVFSDRARSAAAEKCTDIPPEGLAQAIVGLVGRSKEKWPLNFLRRLADQLISLSAARKIGPDHESRWLNLLGYCLRPGFGDALDEHRIQKLWKIYREGPINAKNVQVRSEWWVMWRRAAGGLNATQQRQIMNDLAGLLKPKRGGEKIRLTPQEHMEIWMATANLERLPVPEKIIWGRMLVDDLSPKKSRPQYWWSLSRIGAREPLYGPVDLVVPSDEVADWIDTILSKTWRNPRITGQALAQLARLTGDRKRDMDPDVIKPIIDWLRPHDWSKPLIKVLHEVIPIAPQEESAIFGESLPAGLILHLDQALK
ncbi:MAG: hsp70 family protein [Deltaproteobacteria bacterium]|nr:hsp70 family protein [Deltaproteobacteria bacterium]